MAAKCFGKNEGEEMTWKNSISVTAALVFAMTPSFAMAAANCNYFDIVFSEGAKAWPGLQIAPKKVDDKDVIAAWSAKGDDGYSCVIVQRSSLNSYTCILRSENEALLQKENNALSSNAGSCLKENWVKEVKKEKQGDVATISENYINEKQGRLFGVRLQNSKKIESRTLQLSIIVAY
jgi:hypothetical protein